MKQLGTVLVFKSSVTRDQAEKALEELAKQGLLANNYWTSGKPTIHEFESDFGGPVWYLP